MALGDNNYQNGNNKQSYDPSYYSRLRIKNPNDKLSLGFTYWRGTLRISVSETGDPNEGRNNELAYIHLSPIKARLFANCVERIIKDPEGFDVFGVDTGSGETRGLIAIGRDMGKPYLYIAKVDKNGKYESEQRFNFNFDYNYSLNIADLDKLSYSKEYNNDVELQMFRDLLIDYAKSSSGALGASIYDIGRYETNKINAIIRKMGESMGIETKNKSYSGGGKSYFDDDSESSSNRSSNNKSNNYSKYQSIDDLEDELG